MATKKAGGSSRNGRDSRGKNLGIKKFGGNIVYPGDIIVRQRGSIYHALINTSTGKDYTIFSLTYGRVKFTLAKNSSIFVSVY